MRLLLIIGLILFSSPQQSWSEQLPPTAESTMILIPAGTYKMGFKIDQALSECVKHNDP